MIPVEKLHSHELYLRIFFERCWLIKKIGQNVGPRLTMSNAEPAGWKAYCRRFRGERLGRGCIVPSLFVEKKGALTMVFVDLYTVLVFKDPPPFIGFFKDEEVSKILTANLGNPFSNLCRWRRIRREGPFATPTFFFSESEVLKEVVYIVTHGV